MKRRIRSVIKRFKKDSKIAERTLLKSTGREGGYQIGKKRKIKKTRALALIKRIFNSYRKVRSRFDNPERTHFSKNTGRKRAAIKRLRKKIQKKEEKESKQEC